MNLHIYQKGRNYNIFQDSQDNLVFTGKWFWTWNKGNQLEIRDLEGQLLLTVVAGSSWAWVWNAKYFLTTIYDHQKYEIKCVKWPKRHYQMTGNNLSFDYYRHQGYLKSIFVNNVQVAKVNRANFNFFKKDTIIIRCDSDQNPLLICGLALTFEMGSESDGSEHYINDPNKKHYDDNWRPK
ncbi:hypothetical protein ACFSJU_09345 [Paradesertivirga mongoliensis]|uniref:Uncharacterized protein n=1 Tax=Paradesertivirga mongoliensis TaxID=2100740 RepID=A0ABW4ZLV7_9SPHI|nr:hypothetical protein [Pedobacter mongoliensis]